MKYTYSFIFLIANFQAYEVVRPLLKLLDIENSGLENFEALMGLTNIAGMSESARKRIIKEKGLPLIEHYMFEFHEMIRRAAVQVFFSSSFLL